MSKSIIQADREHCFICGKNANADEIVYIDDSDNVFTADDIGKTVFLTREEAERALKGR